MRFHGLVEGRDGEVVDAHQPHAPFDQPARAVRGHGHEILVKARRVHQATHGVVREEEEPRHLRDVQPGQDGRGQRGHAPGVHHPRRPDEHVQRQRLHTFPPREDVPGRVHVGTRVDAQLHLRNGERVVRVGLHRGVQAEFPVSGPDHHARA